MGLLMISHEMLVLGDSRVKHACDLSTLERSCHSVLMGESAYSMRAMVTVKGVPD